MALEIRDTAADLAATNEGLAPLLSAHSQGAGHPWAPVPVALEAWDGDIRLGGLTGQLICGWLWIMLLAVDPQARGRGVGRRLVAEAESLARGKGALGLNVDTFAYQAPGFYASMGFEEIARLTGPTPAEDRVYFKKDLQTLPS